MEKELKCPKCGSALIDVEDCYDIITCEEGLKELYIGYCMNCGAELQWSELYKLVGYDDFEET